VSFLALADSGKQPLAKLLYKHTYSRTAWRPLR